MWVTISGGGNSLAKIEPNGDVTEYDPAALNGPVGIVSGRDGNLWLTQPNEVAKVPPADPASAEISASRQSLSQGDHQGSRQQALGRERRSARCRSARPTPRAPTSRRPSPAWARAASPRPAAGSGSRTSVGQRIVKVAAGGGIKEYDVGGGPQEVAKGPKGSIAYTNQGSTPHTVGRIERKGKPRKTQGPELRPVRNRLCAGPQVLVRRVRQAQARAAVAERRCEAVRPPQQLGPSLRCGRSRNRLWVSLETSRRSPGSRA